MSVNVRAIAGTTMVVFLTTSFLSDRGAGQARSFMRGDHVREVVDTPADGPTRRGMVVTVVALPGDRIRIENDRLLVNDRVVEGFSTELVAMVTHSKRVPAKMMDNEYLVMGQYTVADGSVVLKWGTYSAQKLEPATADPGK